MAVSIGDRFGGVIVDFIHGAEDSYIVYESRGRLLYQTTNNVPCLREAIDLFHEYMALAEFRLEGAYPAQSRNLIASALVRAFEAKSSDTVREAFRIVEEFIKANTPVQRVFGRASDFVVFMNGAGDIIWDYPHAPVELLPIIAEFEKSIRVAETVLRDDEQLAVKQILGNELTVAFRSAPSVAAPGDVFSASHDFIAKRIEAAVTSRYVIASLSAALVLGLLLTMAIAFPLTWIVADARVLAIGAMAGMIGACISVLQRSSSLTVTQFAPRSQVIFQAIVRMALGIVFGTLVVVAARGNIAFGAFRAQKGRTYSYWVWPPGSANG